MFVRVESVSIDRLEVSVIAILEYVLNIPDGLLRPLCVLVLALIVRKCIVLHRSVRGLHNGHGDVHVETHDLRVKESEE